MRGVLEGNMTRQLKNGLARQLYNRKWRSTVPTIGREVADGKGNIRNKSS